MSTEDQYEGRGVLQRFCFPIGIGAVTLVVVVLVAGQMMKGKKEAPRRAPDVVMIRPLPTPPPPPQQKPPEPPKETVDQMIKQDALTPDDEKPEDTARPTSAGITTSNTGTGGVDMGIGAAGKGGTGQVSSSGRRTQFGWYASRISKTIQAVLARDSSINRASFQINVRIWLDMSGRVIRTKLEKSTGDKTVDEAITERVTGSQLDEPPAGMPMPIVMRYSARRPD